MEFTFYKAFGRMVCKTFDNLNWNGIKRKRDDLLRIIPFKWYLPDLNWGHTDFQSVALPTELRYPSFLESDAKLRRFFRIQNRIIFIYYFFRVWCIYILYTRHKILSTFVH